MSKVGPNAPCPCGSGNKVKRCCRPLHRGRLAETPGQLMRSRYAAYALGEADYILETTHPAGPLFRADRDAWRADVQGFCSGTRFDGLEVLEESADGDVGWVTFHAQLAQAGEDVSFRERSRFERLDGRWLYHSADR